MAYDGSAPRWLRLGFWLCLLIAGAAVIRRVVELAPTQSGPQRTMDLDAVFGSHAGVTLAHILPALAFVVLVPFSILRRFSRLEWPELWLFPLGIIVGFTAYAMSVYSVGGWIERSAVLFYNTLFLFSFGRVWLYRIQRQLNGKETIADECCRHPPGHRNYAASGGVVFCRVSPCSVQSNDPKPGKSAMSRFCN